VGTDTRQKNWAAGWADGKGDASFRLVDRGRSRSMQQCREAHVDGLEEVPRSNDLHASCRHAISTMGASAHSKMASAAL